MCYTLKPELAPYAHYKAFPAKQAAAQARIANIPELNAEFEGLGVTKQVRFGKH